MSEHSRSDGQRVPVGQMRAGDHACMDFTDVEARWGVLTAYTRSGLARGEKVMLVLDPNDLSDDDAVAHVDGGDGQAEAARRSGQLEVHRNTSVYLPDGRFDRDRQYRTYAAAGARANQEGFPVLRLGADMTWATRAGVDDEVMVDYESFIEPLFEPLLADPRFLAICWYDRRYFSDYLVAAMRRVHPLQVMERLGALEVSRVGSGLRIVDSAEPANQVELTDALRQSLGRQSDTTPVRIEVDLTTVCFIEAHYGWQLLDFASALPKGSRVVVRCGSLVEMVLQGLGAGTIPQLELRVEEDSEDQ